MTIGAMATKTGMMAAWLIAAPVLAQTTTAPAPPPAPPPPTTAFVITPIPPTDPVRLAAARPVVDRLWPLGTYQRMMHVMIGDLLQRSMAHAFAMKPDELLAGLGGKPDAKPGEKPAESETLGQMAARNDPYFQQRTAITLQVVSDEVGKVVSTMEPAMRDAIAHAYARRFTAAQLADLDRFFATPTGAAYAADWAGLMMSPDMVDAMQGFTPKLIAAVPGIVAKVTEATKDLPPLGKGKATPPPVVAPPPIPPARKP